MNKRDKKLDALIGKPVAITFMDNETLIGILICDNRFKKYKYMLKMYGRGCTPLYCRFAKCHVKKVVKE